MRDNLNQAQILVQKAMAASARALFLPEASDHISHNPAETIGLVKPVEESEYVLEFQKSAKENKIAITAGIHEPGLLSSKKIRNTAVWVDKEGQIIHGY